MKSKMKIKSKDAHGCKVIRYQTFERVKVRRYVFHNDKRQAEAKEVFVPPPEQLKETKVRQHVFHNAKRQAKAKVEGLIDKNAISQKHYL